MFKWILIGVALLVLIVVGLGGAGWMVLNRPVDTNSEAGQAYAANFKKTFKDYCLAQAVSLAADQDQLEDLCSCAADGIYQRYKDQPPAKLITLSSDPEAQKEVGAIMQECADRAGLQ
jgi:hypothetical protein